MSAWGESPPLPEVVRVVGWVGCALMFVGVATVGLIGAILLSWVLPW